MITWRTSQIENPVLDRRPSIRNGGVCANMLLRSALAIDLAGLSQIHLPASSPSCAATSSDSTLISVGCQHALPSYTKIHSAALAAPPPDISRGFLHRRLSDAGLGQAAAPRSAGIRNPQQNPKYSTGADVFR